MSERKYTKQELWLAFQGASSWKTFQEFFDQNFPPTEKAPFDAELEKHEHINTALKGLKEVREKMKDSGVIDREAFLGHLETALLIMKVNVPMNDVEKIVAIYNCVKEHGSKTSIADLREAIG